jgi:hypothetical protein
VGRIAGLSPAKQETALTELTILAGLRHLAETVAQEAPVSLDSAELRIERHLATLLPRCAGTASVDAVESELTVSMKCVQIAILMVAACATGCGYHVAGKSDIMPQTIHTIAVTPFANKTVQYKFAQRLPQDIKREFIERTHYKIVTDPQTADAVLDGAVLNFVSYPIIADQSTGRATVVQCSGYLKVTLTERATGKVLFSRPSFEVHEQYEISVDPQAYFDESGAGVERLAHDVARDVVTSILEKF